MNKLILIRHGQSEWNVLNKFTGWADVDLTEHGVQEAIVAGKLLASMDFKFDIAYTSLLQRANKTLDYILKELNQEDIEIHKDKALNERHYGDLQGLDKAKTAEEYGKEQVHIWRRSFDVPPPNGESLKDTAARTLPYFENTIIPALHDNNIIVAAHGNSLRSIVMSLENLSAEEILNFEIPTANPRLYEFDSKLNAFTSKGFLL